MAGFAGLYSNRLSDHDATSKLLSAMAEDIRFASDDLVDAWTGTRLGVTRVHHGVLNPEPQPIFNEDRSLCIVMEGEVFDYDQERRSLERVGHRFQFRENDAEYCLDLFAEYGTDAFAKLNGSFALMVYDLPRRELLLVNDRFSSYTLFYHHSGEDLVFGTQLHPLLRWDRLPRRLDRQAVYQFFALRRVLYDRTYYHDVKALPPASILHFRRGQVRVDTYWQAEYRDCCRSAADCAEELAHSLRCAVDRRTRDNHSFGVLLSGGLDSRSVVACCDKPLTAFTLGDFENREVKVAQSVAEKGRCRRVFLERSPDHYANAVDEAVDIGNGMLRVDHSHLLGVHEAIQSHCDILLDSFGFDARFKGAYLIHRQRSLFGRSFHTPRLARVATLDTLESWQRVRYGYFSAAVSELFHAEERASLEAAAVSSLLTIVDSGPRGQPQDLLRETLAGSFRSFGPFLMVLAARAHLPQRSIVFDNDLLDVSLSLPPQVRARGRAFKRALKMLSPGLSAIPDANTALRADFPVWPEWALVSGRIALHEVGLMPQPRLARPWHTQGSWPNMRELIRHNEKLRTLIEETVHDPRCIDPGLFRTEVADSCFRHHMAGTTDFTKVLFALLTFGRWHMQYGPA